MRKVAINMNIVFIITKHLSVHFNSIKRRMILLLEERSIGFLGKMMFLLQF